MKLLMMEVKSMSFKSDPTMNTTKIQGVDIIKTKSCSSLYVIRKKLQTETTHWCLKKSPYPIAQMVIAVISNTLSRLLKYLEMEKQNKRKVINNNLEGITRQSYRRNYY